MKKLTSTLLFLTTSLFSVAYADTPPNLNQINYQINLDQWATTNTARVVVMINATLTNVQLALLHNQIMQNLNKIAPNTDWHITNYNRTQDQSGLEQISAFAETRLAQNLLANLRDNAKAVSKSGANYVIADIDFSPALADIQKTQAALRAEIYAQVNTEIATLDKLYPTQHYFLHELDFETNQGPIPLQANMLLAKETKTEQSSPSMAVSNKVTMTANIVLAATGSSS